MRYNKAGKSFIYTKNLGGGFKSMSEHQFGRSYGGWKSPAHKSKLIEQSILSPQKSYSLTRHEINPYKAGAAGAAVAGAGALGYYGSKKYRAKSRRIYAQAVNKQHRTHLKSARRSRLVRNIAVTSLFVPLPGDTHKHPAYGYAALGTMGTAYVAHNLARYHDMQGKAAYTTYTRKRKGKVQRVKRKNY